MAMIIVTTSRRPSPRMRSLVKDLVAVLPGGRRLTRGHLSMKEIAREAELVGADRVVIIGERRGNPGIMRVYKPSREDLVNIVSFIVKGVTLSRELRSSMPPRQPERLVVETDGTSLADEFADAFVIAFHAVVFEEPSRRDVLARISTLGDDTVLVEYYWGGRRVGPRLKLSKPARMIKVAEA